MTTTVSTTISTTTTTSLTTSSTTISMTSAMTNETTTDSTTSTSVTLTTAVTTTVPTTSSTTTTTASTTITSTTSMTSTTSSSITSTTGVNITTTVPTTITTKITSTTSTVTTSTTTAKNITTTISTPSPSTKSTFVSTTSTTTTTSTFISLCDSECTRYVRGECDDVNGNLTFTRECDLDSCQTTYEEENACPTWSEWGVGFVGDCLDNQRTLNRTCLPGKNTQVAQDCPGENNKKIDCIAIEYSETCTCNGSEGIRKWECEPGTNLHPNDICEVRKNEDCSDLCPVWTVWGQWSAFSPECVNEQDIYQPGAMPTRKRDRNCEFKNGTVANTNHESGNCPFSDKIEKQTSNNYTLCPPPFQDVQINDTQIVTQVKVEFQVEIQAKWTPELNDTESETFQDLADIYIAAFLESLRAIDEVDGTSKIKFAEVRVKRFIRMENNNLRRKRSQNFLDGIKAEMETVYDLIGDKDVTNERDVAPESKETITIDISDQIADRVGKRIKEEIEKNESGESTQGELNFLRIPDRNEIVTKTDVQVLPRLSEYFVMDCNCEMEETRDYYECDADCDSLTGNKKFLVDQGPCSCATWTSWSEYGECGCDDTFQNCSHISNRKCQPAGHYNAEKGERWSINATVSCEGEKIREKKCSGIYGVWEPWTSCDKSCIHKDQQSIRTRQRYCNDTITNSGKIMRFNFG